MADLEFVIEKISGKRANGVLKWPAKGLSSPAVSGPYGNGFLPLGLYKALRNQLLDKPAGSAYCDSLQKCWMQPTLPQFSTTRTDLGIHPDGGVAGTEGCIGLLDADTKPWFDAFFNVAAGGSTSLEVRMQAETFRSVEEERRFVRQPIVAVVGDGVAEHRELADPLGRIIAEMGFTLLTGGGRGVMTAVARAFALTPSREGVSIGVIPAESVDPWKAKDGYPNPWIDYPLFTHLCGKGDPTGPDSRNHINALSGQVLIALPGGKGTRAEITLAVRYGKPVAAFGDLSALGDDVRRKVTPLNSIDEAVRFLREYVRH